MIYKSHILFKACLPGHKLDRTDGSNHLPLEQSNRFVSCLIQKTYERYKRQIYQLPEIIRNERICISGENPKIGSILKILGILVGFVRFCIGFDRLIKKLKGNWNWQQIKDGDLTLRICIKDNYSIVLSISKLNQEFLFLKRMYFWVIWFNQSDSRHQDVSLSYWMDVCLWSFVLALEGGIGSCGRRFPIFYTDWSYVFLYHSLQRIWYLYEIRKGGKQPPFTPKLRIVFFFYM